MHRDIAQVFSIILHYVKMKGPNKNPFKLKLKVRRDSIYLLHFSGEKFIKNLSFSKRLEKKHISRIPLYSLDLTSESFRLIF